MEYDVVNGIKSDRSGRLVLYCLGEVGGGYEIPMDSPGPPIMKALIEADGYQSTMISMDEILFVSKYRIGQIEKEFYGEIVRMNIVEFLAVFEDE